MATYRKDEGGKRKAEPEPGLQKLQKKSKKRVRREKKHADRAEQQAAEIVGEIESEEQKGNRLFGRDRSLADIEAGIRKRGREAAEEKEFAEEGRRLKETGTRHKPGTQGYRDYMTTQRNRAALKKEKQTAADKSEMKSRREQSLKQYGKPKGKAILVDPDEDPGITESRKQQQQARPPGEERKRAAPAQKKKPASRGVLRNAVQGAERAVKMAFDPERTTMDEAAEGLVKPKKNNPKPKKRY